jgi:thioredoxin-like negative regulator of GroEL
VKTVYLEALHALGRRFETSLRRFIEVIRQDRYFDETVPAGCIAIFKVLGEENEITRNFRRSFSSALYV